MLRLDPMTEFSYDPAELQLELEEWLDAFPTQSIGTGGHLLYRGCVTGLARVQQENVYGVVASVGAAPARQHRCELTYVPELGWSGECTCRTEDCAHVNATARALVEALSRSRELPVIGQLPPVPGLVLDPAAIHPKRLERPVDEQALVTQFTQRTGAEPERKQLSFLRNLLDLHRALRSSGFYYHGGQSLQNLAPNAHRPQLPPFHSNPFAHRWAQPPATPLELWSHVALLFTELNIPLPEFMAPFTDLDATRRAIAKYRREREVQAWRVQFAELERNIASAGSATPAVLRSLRLRLGRKKPSWEIATPAPDASAPLRFETFPSNEFRELLDHPDRVAAQFDPAGTAVLAFLRVHRITQGRTTLRLDSAEDRALLGQLLNHPHACRCVVDEAGQEIIRDSRRLVWKFSDDPAESDEVLAQLAFADGSPAPRPLMHLPARPDLYLHGRNLFTGLPPPERSQTTNDPTEPVRLPRAALALPEAQRFAVRAGLPLPGDGAGRFRIEALRPRLRAWVAPRRPELRVPTDEVVFFELAAVGSDGAVRAIFDAGDWRRQGVGVAPPGPEDALLVLDFEPTRAAQSHFLQNRLLFTDAWHPDGFCRHAEISTAFEQNFPGWLHGFPPGTLVDLAPELAAFAQPPTRASYAIDVTPRNEAGGIDWFDVRVTLRVEDTSLTAEEIALLQKARGSFVRLANHGWRRLTIDESPATTEKLAHLGLDPVTAVGETAREPLCFHALQLADTTLGDALPEKLWSAVRERASSLRKATLPETPIGLTAELRPYQNEGFHFLVHLAQNSFGGVLADDMGLGKTLQTLTWLLWLAAKRKKAGAKTRGRAPSRPDRRTRTDDAEAARLSKGEQAFRVLVVCPKSVVVNWQLETARFAPTLRAAPLTTRSASNPVPADTDLVVVNYAQLRLHAEALATETWDVVVLDEGQNIKNPASATAQAARALRAEHRLVLTGTPIENRLLDLWSLFAFAMPGLLGGQTAFKRLYNDKTDAAGARARLAARVKHFLLRRTKSQVARDLPPRVEEEIVCELEGSQRALYDAELKRARQLLLGVKSARQFDAQRFNILQSLLRLRQICCDPRLVGATVDNTGSSAKLDALLETLESLVSEGHRVLVFSQFVTMLELIRTELTSRQIRHLLLTGQTENRQALVDEFQAPGGPSVFLLSLKAAGSGLNLTAASYVVLYDPWWNPAVEAQAIDRTHRIGQRNQVMAYRLLARGTVEEKIRALQREKAALASAVVQEESLATVMDLDSLRQILA